MALFGKKERTSVALVDIASTSVGASLIHLTLGQRPTIYYTLRIPIHRKEHEENVQSMLRTLEEVSDQLITKGAPILRKQTGSGHIDRILVSVGAPWQKTSVRTERLNGEGTPPKPFTFTHALMAETVQKQQKLSEGFRISGESVIATLLNGYEISKPFGKKVTRAELIILTSLLEKSVAEAIEQTMRKAYHTHALSLTAFAPVAYSVFRDVYPHESDFLILHVLGETTDIAFIKRGLLVSVTTVDHGINDLVREVNQATKNARKVPLPEVASETSSSTDEPVIIHSDQAYNAQIEEAQKHWLETLSKAFQEFSSRHALPRALFLLTPDDSREYLRKLLDAQMLRSLWLTEEPLRIIPLASSHLSAFVQNKSQDENDVFLQMLALYANKNKE